MDRNTFQKIHEIIEKSQLSHEEKRDFTELFAQTKEEALRPVLKLLEVDAAWVGKLYKNYLQKKEAIITGNMDAWNDAIQNEKEEIERT
ncbi:MAG: hypothetical protein JKX80_01165 [Candidatus Pacebacteria bacterium]|nr:hypothetical protein [Candidatus Paceibacterota bacterium]